MDHCGSGDQLGYNFTFQIGEPDVQAFRREGESLVIECPISCGCCRLPLAGVLFEQAVVVGLFKLSNQRGKFVILFQLIRYRQFPSRACST